MADAITTLRVTFDIPTDRAGVPVNGSCASILDAVTSVALGVSPSPSCAWESAFILRVTLGGSPTIALGQYVFAA